MEDSMPHAIETTFYAREVPWHGLGTPVESEVTSEDAIVLAGLDWEVATKAVYAPAQNIESGYVVINGYKAVIRLKDNSPLGIVGDRYKPLQNREAFSFFDSVVGEKLA